MSKQQAVLIETLTAQAYVNPEIFDVETLMIDAEKSQYSEHAVAAIQQLWRDAMGAGYE